MKEPKPIKYCKLCGQQIEFIFKRDFDHIGLKETGEWIEQPHVCRKTQFTNSKPNKDNKMAEKVFAVQVEDKQHNNPQTLLHICDSFDLAYQLAKETAINIEKVGIDYNVLYIESNNGKRYTISEYQIASTRL